MDKVPVQSLIDHIKTATDVDPWAKDMAERLLRKQIPVSIEMEGGGCTWWHICDECHGAVDREDLYCRHCGNKLEAK